MVEFKIAGAFLVAVCAALMGIAFQDDMKKRTGMLQDLYRGFLLLRQEIDYMKFPLEEAMIHISRSLKEPWASFFRETGKKLGLLPGLPFLEVWKEMGQRYLEESPLKKEDWDLLWQLGVQLERMEPGDRSGIFGALEQRIRTALSEASEEYREKAQLYKRLGMMGGIFLVILLL